jgi:hypothetical protein
LRPRLIVDADGMTIIRNGRSRSVRWVQLSAVGVERTRLAPGMGRWPQPGGWICHIVGWPVSGTPNLTGGSIERSLKPGALRLFDVEWFGEPDSVIRAVRQFARGRWRN